MPKIVTEKEKAVMREAIYQKGIQIIREKGLKLITVDDIIDAVGIAKGTFYSYYQSKDEWLFEIFTRDIEESYQIFLDAASSAGDFRDNITRALKEIYLGDGSLIFYISPDELMILLNKFPERIEKMNENQFLRAARLFGLAEDNVATYGVLTYLMNGLHYMGYNRLDFNEDIYRQALEIMVESIVDFLCKQRVIP